MGFSYWQKIGPKKKAIDRKHHFLGFKLGLVTILVQFVQSDNQDCCFEIKRIIISVCILNLIYP